jgi:3D (Asp-Asp-Asp) domain-containing protein
MKAIILICLLFVNSFKKKPLEYSDIRATAYTHTETDQEIYGNKSAIGTTLKFKQGDDAVTSAAADWSIFPVGTIFKIKGYNTHYIIEDYGAALVGTKTIDIYCPTYTAMKAWGTKRIDIEIVKMGCFKHSLRILKQRTNAKHVRKMISAIQNFT